MELLKKNLDAVKKRLLTKDQDFVLVIDGPEGKGKSSLALHIATYFDKTFNVNRIVFDMDDFRTQILTSNKAHCILIDEGAFLALSRDSMKADNKDFMKILTACRKFNQLLIICIPNIRYIDDYVRSHRINSLIRVTMLGRYAIYSKKKLKLVRKSKHGSMLKYPRPNVRESFPKFTGAIWKAYLRKKDEKIFDVAQNYETISQRARRLHVDRKTIRKRIEDGTIKNVITNEVTGKKLIARR